MTIFCELLTERFANFAKATCLMMISIYPTGLLAQTPYTMCSADHCQTVTTSLMTLSGPLPSTVRTVCKAQDAYALTFDDGPSANWYEVLSILERHQIPASFFVIGDKLHSETGQQAIRDAWLQGHQISNHSYSHPDLLQLAAADIVWQIQTTEHLIIEALGRLPQVMRDARIMRPPYGYIDQRVEDLIVANQYTSVFWNSDRKDWALSEGESHIVIERLEQHIAYIEAQDLVGLNTSIIDLNHDFLLASLKVLDELIGKVKAAGYRFVTVSECLGLDD
ncbi:MAG: polysaccharide deacetylase family protein [Oligoflexus sp.]